MAQSARAHGGDGGDGGESDTEQASADEIEEEVALAVFAKALYKARFGATSHPTRYLGVWKLPSGRFKACPLPPPPPPPLVLSGHAASLTPY